MWKRVCGFGVSLVLLGSSLVGCSMGDKPDVSTEQMNQACAVMTSHLTQAGLSMRDLIPTDPSDLRSSDGEVLRESWSHAMSALQVAREEVEDVTIGSVIDEALGSLAVLTEISQSAMSGNIGAVRQSMGPLKELGDLALRCAPRTK